MVGSLQPDRQVQAAQNCIGYHYPYHAVAHPRNRYDTGDMLSPTQTIHINHGQITQSNLLYYQYIYNIIYIYTIYYFWFTPQEKRWHLFKHQAAAASLK